MKKCLFLLLSILGTPALAAWSTNINISEIIAEGTDENSSFVIVLSSPLGSDDANSTCEGTYHYLNTNSEKGKMMFTMLMSAKETQMPVRIKLSQGGSATRCQITSLRY